MFISFHWLDNTCSFIYYEKWETMIFKQKKMPHSWENYFVFLVFNIQEQLKSIYKYTKQDEISIFRKHLVAEEITTYTVLPTARY